MTTTPEEFRMMEERAEQNQYERYADQYAEHYARLDRIAIKTADGVVPEPGMVLWIVSSHADPYKRCVFPVHVIPEVDVRIFYPEDREISRHSAGDMYASKAAAEVAMLPGESPEDEATEAAERHRIDQDTFGAIE